jgi:hypothetical protein
LPSLKNASKNQNNGDGIKMTDKEQMDLLREYLSKNFRRETKPGQEVLSIIEILNNYKAEFITIHAYTTEDAIPGYNPQ